MSMNDVQAAAIRNVRTQCLKAARSVYGPRTWLYYNCQAPTQKERERLKEQAQEVLLQIEELSAELARQTCPSQRYEALESKQDKLATRRNELLRASYGYRCEVHYTDYSHTGHWDYIVEKADSWDKLLANVKATDAMSRRSS